MSYLDTFTKEEIDAIEKIKKDKTKKTALLYIKHKSETVRMIAEMRLNMTYTLSKNSGKYL